MDRASEIRGARLSQQHLLSAAREGELRGRVAEKTLTKK